ncbi:MAG: hypothetical protein ACYCW6_16030, partial [Candidatus Xenobia bacterium]
MDGADRTTTTQDALGNRASFSWDSANVFSTGLECHYAYDNDNRVLGKQWFDGAHPVVGDAYTYDPVGNRTSKLELTADRQIRRQEYGYDGLNRLTSSDQASCDDEDENDGDKHGTSWTYDAVGNRLTQSGGDAGFHFGDEEAADAEVSYTYNAKDQMVTANRASFTWDADGNMLSQTGRDGTTTYSWDAQDRLAK